MRTCTAEGYHYRRGFRDVATHYPQNIFSRNSFFNNKNVNLQATIAKRLRDHRKTPAKRYHTPCMYYRRPISVIYRI